MTPLDGEMVASHQAAQTLVTQTPNGWCFSKSLKSRNVYGLAGKTPLEGHTTWPVLIPQSNLMRLNTLSGLRKNNLLTENLTWVQAA
jgi:hypothetical protein